MRFDFWCSVNTPLVLLMTLLLTLWAVLSLDTLCNCSFTNIDHGLDHITPAKIRTPLHLLVQHVSQPVCHIAMRPCMHDSIQVIGIETKLNSQFKPLIRYWGKCIDQNFETDGGG